ncbi:ribosomal protein S18-alanine N-acetyltransferase [Merismopedia glauca]|uniref:Ribosomal-protein-alanine N-acetyltransferase n=1 Tax=Merismopedia glauca CCAP 1448/3 TaxID=1296344 RepID=A0A2T1C335_9CYAN|nr:ribosomal protein S18-alanine N-acetyltransferase [Merismopedia glauca]PSB02679.1 ribosomal-protein-alanine N-acetyltransferase [Merismopedia glauca CCAP 1448/3]
MVTYLQFKPLTAADLPAVLELDQLCFSGLWTLEGYQRELASDRSHFLLLSVAHRDGLANNLSEPTTVATKIPHIEITDNLLGIGCFWSIVEESHITLLAIHPKYRRQGLGQMLLYGLLKKAWEEGLERATLEVRAGNQDAISLYAKFGFKLAGKRPRYYQDNNEDALILWRGGLQYPEFAQTLANWEIEISDRHCC